MSAAASDAPSATHLAPDGAERACAKINLALHVTGRREDGYHLLDSLVAFAAFGDVVAVRPSPTDRLDVAGPFAPDVPRNADNILLKTLALARARLAERGVRLEPLAIHLDKRLPVASGIGGGSADAAALLRLLTAGDPDRRAALSGPALSLGADVPMCLSQTPCRVGGIGETIAPLPRFPAVPLVLVNPGTPVSTPAIFRALAQRNNAPLRALPQGGFSEPSGLVAYLGGTRNDLEAPALSLAPAIGSAKRALERNGALYAGMSGSGATVFALFATAAAAAAAAADVRRAEPGWWVEATTLRPAPEPVRSKQAVR